MYASKCRKCGLSVRSFLIGCDGNDGVCWACNMDAALRKTSFGDWFKKRTHIICKTCGLNYVSEGRVWADLLCLGCHSIKDKSKEYKEKALEYIDKNWPYKCKVCGIKMAGSADYRKICLGCMVLARDGFGERVIGRCDLWRRIVLRFRWKYNRLHEIIGE